MIRCLLMLQIFISFREPLALPLISFLFKGGKKFKKYTFPQEFSNWEMLEGSCKRKDEVTADLNSDPNFQRTIKMSLLFYLKQLTNYCWMSYLGGGNVSVSLGLRRRWETGKVWNTGWVWCSLLGGQQCWGQEMPWGAWHCTGVDASSHPLAPDVFWASFSPFLHSIICLVFWVPEHSPLALGWVCTCSCLGWKESGWGHEYQGETAACMLGVTAPHPASPMPSSSAIPRTGWCSCTQVLLLVGTEFLISLPSPRPWSCPSVAALTPQISMSWVGMVRGVIHGKTLIASW